MLLVSLLVLLPVSLQDEAVTQAKAAWARHLSACDTHYFSRNLETIDMERLPDGRFQVYAVDHPRRRWRLLEFAGIQFQLRGPRALSEADRLNGLEWVGESEIVSVAVWRSFRGGRWSTWQDGRDLSKGGQLGYALGATATVPLLAERFTLTRRNGRWAVETPKTLSSWQVIPCSELTTILDGSLARLLGPEDDTVVFDSNTLHSLYQTVYQGICAGAAHCRANGFILEPVDLNNDGVDEYIAAKLDTCGAHNCEWVLIFKVDNRWRVLARHLGVIKVRPSLSRGFHDIVFFSDEYRADGPRQDVTTEFLWDGSRYVSKE